MNLPTGFTVIPAVDIKGGRCVRLFQGLPDEETVFGEDPVVMAQRWEEEGARLLHVVDLDGAFQGRPVNRDIILDIASRLTIPVEVGGGIRNSSIAHSYLNEGVARVIVGTAAFENPEWLVTLAGELKDSLVVGMDIKEGHVAVDGWAEIGTQGPLEAVEWLADAGVRRIIYTDISKDGTLRGHNISGIEQLVARTSVGIIASGGIGELGDIDRVAGMTSLGVEGVIVGMALYKNKFTLAEALAAAEEGGASRCLPSG